MKLFVHPIEKFNLSIKENAKILDVGALNFSQYKRTQNLKIKLNHYGIDYCDPTEKTPPNYIFKKCDLNKEKIPFEDDYFDVIVASHIIEHLNEPLNFFRECMRVLKPSGMLYIEAPSERSLLLKGNTICLENMYAISLYDDPTHTMRPWTIQAFYRLAKYYNCNPIETKYIESYLAKLIYPFIYVYAKFFNKGRLFEKYTWLSKGWAVYMICTKNFSGNPKFHYFIPSRND